MFAAVVDVPDAPVYPCGPVGPTCPVGPSIPSKFTLYTTVDVKLPLIF